MEPRGLLCDEITSALDPELKSEVLDVLLDLKAEGLTLIMVTHEIHFARRAADRVLLRDGRSFDGLGPEWLRIGLQDRGGNGRILRALAWELRKGA